MVEHKHILLHVPKRKSHMVSCLGILGAKSVVPKLWVRCGQSNLEKRFHLETDELSCANVAVRQSYGTLGHGRSRGTSFIHLGFVDAEIQGIHKRMARFQKLTINLFLNLHGQNVHRQQRQLSQFLMR